MICYDACRESLNPIQVINWAKYKLDFIRAHPFYFKPDGLIVFTGPQGTGKTLSAVNYVIKLMLAYPRCKLVTNLMLSDFPIVTFEEFINNNMSYIIEITKKDNITLKELKKDKVLYVNLYLKYKKENRVFKFENGDSLKEYDNGEYGVIFLIDEIQLYFNSLQSKNINSDVMTQISQQRKQRKHIVATSQVFGRMAKPLREQFSSVLVCKNYFGFLQFNKLVDRDSVEENDNGTTLKGKVKKRFIWFHSPKYYGRYDTYYVIQQNNFIAEEEKKVGIYGTELSMCYRPSN